MTYDEIVAQVSHDLGLPRVLVNRTYKSYWKAIREYVKALPLKEDLTDEEFLRLRPNVNIPSIGKLYVTLDRYKGLKRQEKIIQEFKRKKHAKD